MLMFFLWWYYVCCACCWVYVFFFKQKTAYEMRISDWSSDVCSSDLLEDPLNGVLVHVQQPCHRAIAKRRLFLDQRLDWPRQVRVDLGRRLGWLVVNRPTRHTEPAAQLADRHRKAVVLESLLDRGNHASSLPNRDRSEEHTSELQSLMRISYAVFGL